MYGFAGFWLDEGGSWPERGCWVENSRGRLFNYLKVDAKRPGTAVLLFKLSRYHFYETPGNLDKLNGSLQGL